jgi:glyoxylase-like metal-dependent hydrolase (beta-lactamase superfamily II)
MYDDECLHAMETALTKLGIDMDKTDFFITHCHGDHIGLVTRIIRDGSIVYINEQEMRFISKIRTGALHAEIKTFLEISGFPEKDPTKILPYRVKDEFRGRATLPFKLIDDGDMDRERRIPVHMRKDVGSQQRAYMPL